MVVVPPRKHLHNTQTSPTSQKQMSSVSVGSILRNINEATFHGDGGCTDDVCADDAGRQGGHALSISVALGATALPDGSVVLVGETDGDFTAPNSHVGGKDFAVIKLTADGVTHWTWQVTRRDLRNFCILPATNSFTAIRNDDDGYDNDGKEHTRGET